MGRAFPLVIVGCGPAGLAAANAFQRHGGGEVLVLEAGGAPRDRRRDHAADVVRGVGGAGLYSDGKFSFYPAATGLWSLADGPRLQSSCAWVWRLLRSHGVAAPPLPESARPQEPGPNGFKPYPSTYLDLQARVGLIEALYAPVAEAVRLGARLESLSRAGGALELTVTTPRGQRTIRARQVICAGGRFFPLLLQRQEVVPTRFMRLELGVRLVGPAAHPFFAQLAEAGRSIDPKLILPSADGSLEWRTFCFCPQGELVLTRDYGLRSYSGRSDCPPSGSSNVGFNVRFRTAEAARGVSLDRLRRGSPYRQPLARALRAPGPLEAALGPRAGQALLLGLSQLRERFSALQRHPAGLSLVGPTVEGVGEYPASDGELRGPGAGLHFAGDCVGKFRGIVAALVSGAYVGQQVAAQEQPGGPCALPRAPGQAVLAAGRFFGLSVSTGPECR